MSADAAKEAVRADVWLWRARFFKTRSAAAAFVEEGRIRLTRIGQETRLDKPARPVKVGDDLVFALGGKLIAVTVAALGERRGPPAEARGLYGPLEASSRVQQDRGIDKPPSGLEKPAPSFQVSSTSRDYGVPRAP